MLRGEHINVMMIPRLIDEEKHSMQPSDTHTTERERHPNNKRAVYFVSRSILAAAGEILDNF